VDDRLLADADDRVCLSGRDRRPDRDGHHHGWAAAASAATLRVFGALLFARPAAAGPAQASLAPYLISGAAIGVFFLVAVVLMWVRARQNWVAAAVAAFIGGGAWWLLAYAVLAQHPAPPVQSAVVFVVMTAVVTLGVLAATLQRARDED
jgi:hypothetical protein